MKVSGQIEGSVHGRFQPFHVEHLEYVLAAKQRCDFLWIGITASPAVLSPLGRLRERPEANPLTFYERVVTIGEVLTSENVPADEYAVVPFPIETPALLTQYLPLSVTCFTTICEDWNREKIKVLQAAGYRVEVLWEREKRVSGSQIRASILAGDNDWTRLVPPGTADAVLKFGIQARLRVLVKATQA